MVAGFEFIKTVSTPRDERVSQAWLPE